MASNQNILTDICTLYQQRRKEQLLNVPPSRETLISPYETTNFTKFQLDMRRKAEVLKYNSGNTKTNKLSKKQLWSQLVKGNAPKIYIKGNTVIETEGFKVYNCNGQPIISSASAAGVPNTGVNSLFYDPNVVLYNYQNPVLTRSYGVVNGQEPTNPIVSVKYTDVYTTGNTLSNIASIMFTNAAINPSYNINLLNIPLAIQIEGVLEANHVNQSINSIVINSFSIKAYYNNSLVPINSDYGNSFIYGNTIIPNNKEMTLNISAGASETRFLGTQYIGLLNLTNITLKATPGYIYDIILNGTIGFPKSYTGGIASMRVSLISNVSSNYLIQNPSYNCTITPSTSVSGFTFGDFQVTAV
jgi:hypothetical protein